ncbi:hypothetical protein [Streptomyces prasinosporus]|uniref:hypothetical protein n=1 Tax=Streptomyces prasinosporus TaxID=68256 RepID=UPI0031E9F4C8
MGPPSGGEPDELTVGETPLRAAGGNDDLAGADDLLGMLRALHTGTRIFSSSRMGTVMGMRLVHVDPAAVVPAGLRLYVDREEDTTVVAADIRPSGALTAVLAALPSLIGEAGVAPGDDDPHCSRLVDLTGW